MNFTIQNKSDFEAFVTSHWSHINQFINRETEDLPIPLYSSVDIRESKFKFAPVDHNLYPAGFNNLCQLDLDASGKLFRQSFDNLKPNATHIAIIPEGHTKNTFYLDNLIFLGKTIADEGYQVSFVSLDEHLFSESQEALELASASNFNLIVKKGKIEDGFLKTKNQSYDLAVLNNDQSSPFEVDWEKVQTPILPPPQLGWVNRKKINHFSYYQKVIEKFSKEFSINPNLLQAKFRKVNDVDFSSKKGLENLAKEVDKLLEELPEKTQIFIKASQGTYGMGISVVTSGEEILHMNRKTRNKMDVGKNKIKFTSLLIQEGVESIVQYDGMAAEVAIYLVNGKATGGFVRANSDKGANANLNSKGMLFRKYCISEIRENNDAQAKEAVYSIVARLATWASALEIEEVLNH